MYEDETLSYVPVNDDDNTVCFVLSADNGLNGANVTWQFPGMPSLNGSTTVPEYRTTAEQLANFVPYVEYISSGLMINGIKWRIVSLDNEAIPFPQDFEMKIKIDNVYGEEYSNIAYQDLDEFKTIPAGETPEGEFYFDEPVDEAEIWAIRIRVETYETGSCSAYRWRFYNFKTP